MSEVKAQLNNLRLAPRKVRAVSNLVKNKNAPDAVNQLEVVTRRSGLPILKLLKSAMANAENNRNMVKENLYIKSIEVDEGVKLKRFKPKGFGRVSPIEKKTSHVRLILAERVPGLKRTLRPEKKEKREALIRDAKDTKKQEFKNPLDSARIKPEIKTELGKKEGRLKSLGKRIFRRKVI